MAGPNIQEMSKTSTGVYFPFTAIVGQENAKLALLCNAVNPAIGGVLLSGDKGTGKSTIVRALADVLPLIETTGCPFNCNPQNEIEMCEECLNLNKKESDNPSIKRKMKVVDLPLSVTIDRVVGTIDIQKALKEGIRALHPGILAEANRNILYIDEVNLLDDYIADALLDSAALGWNIIEREGVSLKHPSRFILIGSMNPEEGELRPQIFDRFGLFIRIKASGSVEERIEIAKRAEGFQADPFAFRKRHENEQERLRRLVAKAKEILNEVEIDEELWKLLVKTIVENGIQTHRAEIVTVRTAKAIAALNARKKVNLEDLKKAMELALQHRINKPFKPPSPPKVEDKDDNYEQDNSKQNQTSSEQQTQSLPQSQGQISEESQIGEGQQTQFHFQSQGQTSENMLGNREEQFESSDVNIDLNFPLNRYRSRKETLRGSRDEKATVIGYPSGYQISNTLPTKAEQMHDVDIPATIRASASSLKDEVAEENIRVRVRKTRLQRLSVLLLDSSGSMAAMRKISTAKGIARKIIENSYKKRDLLALTVFKGYKADILVPPTRSYASIMDALHNIRTGGRTPLSSALQTLQVLARNFRIKNKNSVVKCFLVSDGKANTPLNKSIKEEIQTFTLAIKKNKIKFEIYDTRTKSIDPSPSYIELLSELLNAPVYRV